MYEHLYSLYEEKVNGRTIIVSIIPNFLNGSVDIFSEKRKISTSSGNYHLEAEGDYDWIFVPENTQWVIISQTNYPSTRIIITEHTKTINSDYGDEWNKIFNELRIKAQKQYYQKKNSEVRLYFWNSEKKQLKLCLNHRKFSYGSLGSKLSYYPQEFHYGQALDRKCTIPQYDCFILGKVCKTIGTKKGTLFDYIKPISEIKLDFSKQDHSITSFYYCDLVDFETLILNLLVLCIEHTDTGKSAILPDKAQSLSRQKCETPDFEQFLNEVKKALSAGDTKRLRDLQEVMYNFDV